MDVTAYNRPATLYDICQRTGLSTATVSRVINDSPNVRPKTRERILRAARELGYVPSHHARALAGKGTRTLGVVFPRIASGFYAEVLEGIDETAAEHGLHLSAAFSRDMQTEEQIVERFLRERRVDALILMNLLLPQRVVRALRRAPIPVVLLARPTRGAGLTTFTVDNVAGADAAMTHLLSHGYRDIAILQGPGDTYDAQQRLLGCQRAAERAKVELGPQSLWPGDFTEESARALMDEHLRRGRPLPEAIFALNDAMALGVLDALRVHGRSAPEDVALVGFDDIESARHLGLTTVHSPMRRMGREAGAAALESLQQRTDGDGSARRAAHRVLPTRLVVRRSCGGTCGRIEIKTFSTHDATSPVAEV